MHHKQHRFTLEGDEKFVSGYHEDFKKRHRLGPPQANRLHDITQGQFLTVAQHPHPCESPHQENGERGPWPLTKPNSRSSATEEFPQWTNE